MDCMGEGRRCVSMQGLDAIPENVLVASTFLKPIVKHSVICHIACHCCWDVEDPCLCLSCGSKLAFPTLNRYFPAATLYFLFACGTGAPTEGYSKGSVIVRRLSRPTVQALVVTVNNVSDAASLVFAYHFYSELANGKPILGAFVSAQRTVLCNSNEATLRDARKLVEDYSCTSLTHLDLPRGHALNPNQGGPDTLPHPLFCTEVADACDVADAVEGIATDVSRSENQPGWWLSHRLYMSPFLPDEADQWDTEYYSSQDWGLKTQDWSCDVPCFSSLKQTCVSRPQHITVSFAHMFVYDSKDCVIHELDDKLRKVRSSQLEIPQHVSALVSIGADICVARGQTITLWAPDFCLKRWRVVVQHMHQSEQGNDAPAKVSVSAMAASMQCRLLFVSLASESSNASDCSVQVLSTEKGETMAMFQDALASHPISHDVSPIFPSVRDSHWDDRAVMACYSYGGTSRLVLASTGRLCLRAVTVSVPSGVAWEKAVVVEQVATFCETEGLILVATPLLAPVKVFTGTGFGDNAEIALLDYNGHVLKSFSHMHNRIESWAYCAATDRLWWCVNHYLFELCGLAPKT